MLFDQIQLEGDEKVLKVVRKHWFIPFMEFLATGLVALLPFVLLAIYAVLPESEVLPSSLRGYYAYIVFGTCLWLVICAMGAIMFWTHYYLDLWVITDRRLIVIKQLGFFSRKTSNFRLERLQDIKVRVDGILATFLNFGTLRAQTASASDSVFQMTSLPDPRGLQALMQQAMDNRIRNLQSQPANPATFSPDGVVG